MHPIWEYAASIDDSLVSQNGSWVGIIHVIRKGRMLNYWQVEPTARQIIDAESASAWSTFRKMAPW